MKFKILLTIMLFQITFCIGQNILHFDKVKTCNVNDDCSEWNNCNANIKYNKENNSFILYLEGDKYDLKIIKNKEVIFTIDNAKFDQYVCKEDNITYYIQFFYDYKYGIRIIEDDPSKELFSFQFINTLYYE